MHFSLDPAVLRTAAPPSIFNDVFGPVMIGPSSSHSAAAYRIGRLCRDLLGGRVTRLEARYNRGTALANTHRGQGTDRGLYGAILGWELTDPRMQGFDAEIEAALETAGIALSVAYPDFGVTHASFYHLTVGNDAEVHRVEAVSTGGGMFRILRIDGAPVRIEGDYHELLVFCGDGAAGQLAQRLKGLAQAESVTVSRGDAATIVQVRSARPYDDRTVRELAGAEGVHSVRLLAPVLPVLSRADLAVPFLSASDMLGWNRERNLALWELAVHYECARGGLSEAAVRAEMSRLVAIMRQSVDAGVVGTDYADRLLTAQAPHAAAAMRTGTVPDDAVAKMILFTAAIMDVKSAMGVFVAAPTAGSCGTTPGAILGFADAMGRSDAEIVEAMLAAGLIGVFIAAHATFSAELAGCMAETGASGAMAAAGLVHLMGGDLDQALTAAGSTINTGLGLICDPIADRVEAPCMEKNIAAAMRAYGAAISSVMGFSPVIPFDESVQAMDAIGRAMPDSMCCTGGAGLCQTRTGQRLLDAMRGRTPDDRHPGSLLIAGHETGG